MTHYFVQVVVNGLIPVLTGGYFHDTRQSHFTNVFHFYLWLLFFWTPYFLTDLVEKGNSMYWLVYVICCGLLVLLLKLVNLRLHHLLLDKEDVKMNDDSNTNEAISRGASFPVIPDEVILENVSDPPKVPISSTSQDNEKPQIIAEVQAEINASFFVIKQVLSSLHPACEPHLLRRSASANELGSPGVGTSYSLPKRRVFHAENRLDDLSWLKEPSTSRGSLVQPVVRPPPRVRLHHRHWVRSSIEQQLEEPFSDTELDPSRVMLKPDRHNHPPVAGTASTAVVASSNSVVRQRSSAGGSVSFADTSAGPSTSRRMKAHITEEEVGGDVTSNEGLEFEQQIDVVSTAGEANEPEPVVYSLPSRDDLIWKLHALPTYDLLTVVARCYGGHVDNGDSGSESADKHGGAIFWSENTDGDIIVYSFDIPALVSAPDLNTLVNLLADIISQHGIHKAIVLGEAAPVLSRKSSDDMVNEERPATSSTNNNNNNNQSDDVHIRKIASLLSDTAVTASSSAGLNPLDGPDALVAFLRDRGSRRSAGRPSAGVGRRMSTNDRRGAISSGSGSVVDIAPYVGIGTPRPFNVPRRSSDHMWDERFGVRAQQFARMFSHQTAATDGRSVNRFTFGSGPRDSTTDSRQRRMYKIRPIPLSSYSMTLRFDRIALEGLFDKTMRYADFIVHPLLAALVASLASLAIHKGYYDGFPLVAFCFVIATAQYCLIKSPQPDSASPQHGYNPTIVYSRPVYFTAVVGLLIGASYVRTDVLFEKYALYGLTLTKSTLIDVLFVASLALPTIFLLGWLPQISTLTMLLCELANIHVFGGSGLLSLGTGVLTVLKSTVLMAALWPMAFVALGPAMVHGVPSPILSVYLSCACAISYMQARSSANLGLWADWLRARTGAKSDVEQEPKSNGNNDPLMKSLRSALVHRLVSDVVMGVLFVVIVFAAHVSTLFSFDVTMYLVVILVGILGFVVDYLLPELRTYLPWSFFRQPLIAKSATSSDDTRKPASESSKPEVMENIKKATGRPTHASLPKSGSLSTPTDETVILYLRALTRVACVCAVLTFATQSVYRRQGQMASGGPEDGRPSSILSLLPTPFAALVFNLCVMKAFRAVFVDSTYVWLSFPITLLWSRWDAKSYGAECLIVDHALIVTFVVLAKNFINKLNFVYCYTAPWHAPWGSFCHAIVHPLAVPHSTLILTQTTLATLISAPMVPLLGSGFFLMSYPRCLKFWEKDYNTKRKDATNTRLDLLLQDGETDERTSESINALFYESMTRALCRQLAGDVASGRLITPIRAGDTLMLTYEDGLGTAFVNIVEVGAGLVTFQLRGLELAGTFCQRRELDALMDVHMVAKKDDLLCCGPLARAECCRQHCQRHMLSCRASMRLRWNAWRLMQEEYILKTYSINEYDVMAIFPTLENRRLYVSCFAMCVMYLSFKAGAFDRCARDERIMAVAREHWRTTTDVTDGLLSWGDEFRGVTFHMTRRQFVEKYRRFIEACCRRFDFQVDTCLDATDVAVTVDVGSECKTEKRSSDGQSQKNDLVITAGNIEGEVENGTTEEPERRNRAPSKTSKSDVREKGVWGVGEFSSASSQESMAWDAFNGAENEDGIISLGQSMESSSRKFVEMQRDDGESYLPQDDRMVDLLKLCWLFSVTGRQLMCAGASQYTKRKIYPYFIGGVHALLLGDIRLVPDKHDWVMQEMTMLETVKRGAGLALKLFQGSFIACDDEEYERDVDTLLESLNEYTADNANLVICNENDPACMAAVQADVEEILTLREMNSKSAFKEFILRLDATPFRLTKINPEVVRGLWAAQMSELIFMRNNESERGSIQNFKQVMRNMIGSSCDQPIGYPIYVSPLMTSFTSLHPDPAIRLAPLVREVDQSISSMARSMRHCFASIHSRCLTLTFSPERDIDAIQMQTFGSRKRAAAAAPTPAVPIRIPAVINNVSQAISPESNLVKQLTFPRESWRNNLRKAPPVSKSHKQERAVPGVVGQKVHVVHKWPHSLPDGSQRFIALVELPQLDGAASNQTVRTYYMLFHEVGLTYESTPTSQHSTLQRPEQTGPTQLRLSADSQTLPSAMPLHQSSRRVRVSITQTAQEKTTQL